MQGQKIMKIKLDADNIFMIVLIFIFIGTIVLIEFGYLPKNLDIDIPQVESICFCSDKTN